ncbi:MAG: hypothetical protein HOP29_13690 [Phycisphaerales bacterium]|nr:hypothetical protein [Phycisphaerales bacterium]
MNPRHTILFAIGIVVALTLTPAAAVDKLVTADANISTLVTANDTVLIWTGNHTVTVDATTAFTVAGINAGGFTATISFGAADRKVVLGNSAGNVVIQSGAGELRATGAGAGARTAGFLVPASVSGEIVEINTAIDDADNANHWTLGNNTVRFTSASARIGTLDIGFDGGVATLDCDFDCILSTLTPTGDFTIDLAAATTLKLNAAASLGADTLNLIGAATTSQINATAGFTLNSSSARLNVTGTALITDLNLGGSATINLNSGAALTLTDAVPIGALTLTLSGTTGTSAETITATGGFTLNSATSQLKISGDTAHALVVSKVDIAGADLTTGKLDVDENATITALTVSQNATIDVASGKTLGGTATLNAAKTLTLNNTGTLSTLNTATAAGTVLVSAAGTVSTLTNTIAGTTLDINESSTITALAANANTTLDVAATESLTTTATVAAAMILTSIGAGTVSTVALNGTNAELNTTTTPGIIGTLNVTANGGILDVDVACTIPRCTMTSAAGDLTVQNGGQTITSVNGFDVNSNALVISEANGHITNVILDTSGGEVVVNASTTVATTTVSASSSINIVGAPTYQSVVNVAAGAVLTCSGGGAFTTINLNGALAELNMTGSLASVADVNVNANGAVIDVDQNCTLPDVTLLTGSGDLTLEVAAGRILTGAIGVKDNRLTLTESGNPGTIMLDAAGAVLQVDESVTPTAVTMTANAAIDVADGKTLTATVAILNRELTLLGDGAVSRVDATTGRLDGDGDVTVGDLRLTLPAGESFRLGGTGTTTVTTTANSTLGANAIVNKLESGTVTLTGGATALFAGATGVRLDIDAGELVIGSDSANHDITFNDDGDEIIVADDATLTTFGSITAGAAGSNVNIDAVSGSTVNLRSSGGAETFSAAADDDFKLLGQVNIDGDNGDYSLAGAFKYQFGDIAINDSGSFIDFIPFSTLRFRPGAVITLDGDAVLNIDGQSPDSPVIMSAVNATDAFRLDRGSSDSVTIANVTLSRSEYTSDDGGSALDELGLDGVTDAGNNINWFTPAPVDDDDDDNGNGNDNDDGDNGNDNDNDNGNQNGNQNGNGNDNGDDEPPATYTDSATIDSDGQADASVASDVTGAGAMLGIDNATSGSIVLMLADGNLRDDFDGILDGDALPFTARVDENLFGEFTAVVQMCYTDELLADADLTHAPLAVYVFDETSGRWVLAGDADQNRGDAVPTDAVGDFGVDRDAGCVWVVRDSLSDFAVGRGPAVPPPDDSDDDDDDDPTPPRICGLIGFIPMMLMIGGWTAWKGQSRRRRIA